MKLLNYFGKSCSNKGHSSSGDCMSVFLGTFIGITWSGDEGEPKGLMQQDKQAVTADTPASQPMQSE